MFCPSTESFMQLVPFQMSQHFSSGDIQIVPYLLLFSTWGFLSAAIIIVQHLEVYHKYGHRNCFIMHVVNFISGARQPFYHYLSSVSVSHSQPSVLFLRTSRQGSTTAWCVHYYQILQPCDDILRIQLKAFFHSTARFLKSPACPDKDFRTVCTHCKNQLISCQEK